MSPIGAIDSLRTGIYEVQRRTSGSYVDGELVPGASSLFSMVASIQPVTGRAIDNLPEARRGSEVIVIYTVTELRTESPDGAADQITYRNENWEVWKVERWEAFGDVHFRCYASRTEPL